MSPRRGLAITDLFAIAAILLLLVAVGVPTLERAREMSKRMVCATNLKALGGAGHVYADANKGQWMTPPFSNRAAFAAGAVGIDYLCHGQTSSDLACIGFERERQSKTETPTDPSAGSTAVSATRAYWMLVRSGAVSAVQFICPSSSADFPDPTQQVHSYYDFTDYKNISYGYLVPFGPPDTRPRAGSNNRVVMAADKGPFYKSVNLDFMTAGPNDTPLLEEHAPQYWRRFNSPNHGGIGVGEGQNVLHSDGNVEFLRKPLGGVDGDNIFSLMEGYFDVLGFNRIHGASPHQSAAPNPYPGKWTFCQYPTCYSSTDSLIYP